MFGDQDKSTSTGCQAQSGTACRKIKRVKTKRQ